VQFDGDTVRLGMSGEQPDVQISGTASDLALFLWQRKVAGRLEVQGDASLLSGYFVLVPPL
jgi:MDMPI C-terminal domain